MIRVIQALKKIIAYCHNRRYSNPGEMSYVMVLAVYV